MVDIAPFTPQWASKVIEATTTTDNVELAGNGTERTAKVSNSGTVKCFVNFGVSGVEAVVDTNMVILPGTSEIFAINKNITHMAAVMDSGTADIHITEGQGV